MNFLIILAVIFGGAIITTIIDGLLGVDKLFDNLSFWQKNTHFIMYELWGAIICLTIIILFWAKISPKN